eukprot:9958-Heterococcus_DN1.PRE.1
MARVSRNTVFSKETCSSRQQQWQQEVTSVPRGSINYWSISSTVARGVQLWQQCAASSRSGGIYSGHNSVAVLVVVQQHCSV